MANKIFFIFPAGYLTMSVWQCIVVLCLLLPLGLVGALDGSSLQIQSSVPLREAYYAGAFGDQVHPDLVYVVEIKETVVVEKINATKMEVVDTLVVNRSLGCTLAAYFTKTVFLQWNESVAFLWMQGPGFSFSTIQYFSRVN